MLRRLTPLALFATVMLVAGCATQPTPSCELGASVPEGAVFGVRNDSDIATYPAAVPATGAACQRVWYGERSDPGRMQVLATYYFDHGRVQRLVGQVPGGPQYDCTYRDGALDTTQSRHSAQCPAASEIERRP